MNCVAAPKTKHAKRRHDCLDGKDDWEVQEEEVDDSSMADHRSILGQTKQYVRQNRMNLGLPLLQALSSTSWPWSCIIVVWTRRRRHSPSPRVRPRRLFIEWKGENLDKFSQKGMLPNHLLGIFGLFKILRSWIH